MSKTLIIGASGQIVKMAPKLLLNKEQNVSALVGDISKLDDLDCALLTIVEIDLEGDLSGGRQDWV
ncbi:hypothetical protein CWB60_20490, partial [Pseudoalteromonas sp. S327]